MAILKCSKCHTKLYIHQPSSDGGSVMMWAGEDLEDKLNRQPRGCTACYKNYCSVCTYNNGRYVCPDCGRIIGTLDSKPVLIGDESRYKNAQLVDFNQADESVSVKRLRGRKVCALCNCDIPEGAMQCSRCGKSYFTYIADKTEIITDKEICGHEYRDEVDLAPQSGVPLESKKWWEFWKNKKIKVKNVYSMGVPLEYKCERCGEKLHAGTGGIVAGGMDVLNHLTKRVKRCPLCGKVFCGKCSVEVDEELGRPRGAVDFTCPFCRKTGIPG